MNKVQTFEQFLVTQSVQIPVFGFLLNLILATLLAYLLSVAYVQFGTSLSNRRMFARNFMLITMTTMLIISIVKSSLALSLGLVGALSIVRFRAAIKEPEELAYLFLCIAIGLGFGADQRAVTLVAFIVIVGLLALRHRFQNGDDTQNLQLIVSSHNPQKATLESIVSTLRKYARTVNLKRFDESKEQLEASFLVEFNSYRDLEKSKNALQKLGDSVTVSFLENKGLV